MKKAYLIFVFLIIFSFESFAIIGPAVRNINIEPGQTIEFYNVCDQLSISYPNRHQQFTLSIDDFSYTSVSGITVVEEGAEGCSKSIHINSSASPGSYTLQADITTTQTLSDTRRSVNIRGPETFHIQYIYKITVQPSNVPSPTPTPDPAPSPTPNTNVPSPISPNPPNPTNPAPSPTKCH